MLRAVRRRTRAPPAASSVDELIAGATTAHPAGRRRRQVRLVARAGRDRRASVVLKHVHPDDDWTMRGFGDLGCRPVAVWTSGLVDAAPRPHRPRRGRRRARGSAATAGAALLLRDVGAAPRPGGRRSAPGRAHRQLARPPGGAVRRVLGLARTTLGAAARSSAAGVRSARSGWRPRSTSAGPTPCPAIAGDGWVAFAERGAAPTSSPRRRRCATTSTRSSGTRCAATPLTFLHGDWKLGNLGSPPTAAPCCSTGPIPAIGPIVPRPGWYLALNRARLPGVQGGRRSTRSAPSLERHGIDTDGWWERQLGPVPARRARAVRLGEGARRRRRARLVVRPGARRRRGSL